MLPVSLVLVTDRHTCEQSGRDPAKAIDRALSALPPAAALVQVREKDLSARELYSLTRKLLEVTRRYHCPLLINDRVDVALAAGADGVHLPESGLPIAAAARLAGPGSKAGDRKFVIGRSVHSADGAGAAARDGADLILCGPMYATLTKPQALPSGELSRAARAVADAKSRARLYAIGGITDGERARAARAAGAHGVALIRAWQAHDDAGALVREIYQAISDSRP